MQSRITQRVSLSVLAGIALLLWATDVVATNHGKGEFRMRGGVKLTPMGYPELEGWDADDHLAAFKSFLISCDRVLTQAKERANTGRPAPSAALVQTCLNAKKLAGTVSRESARAFFEANFTPHAVVHKGRPGLLTGYYEPVLQGSRTAQGAFQYPIYKRPADLVTLVDETKGSKAGTMTHGRRTDKGVMPFYTRAEIEQGALSGRNLEFLYFSDPVDVFFMHIQGSGRVQLTDGTMIRVGYDGKNGHSYASIGRYIIDKGLMAAEKVSLASLRTWLNSDRERGKQVMWQNPSFIFFREMGEESEKGPLGALGAPLSAGRSIAVDPGYHALGTPIFVTAHGMSHVEKSGTFARLMIAQDVGSAIKGPERGDLYFGSGDAAGKVAGVTRHKGNFAVLVPNAVPSSADASGPKP